MGSIPFTRSRFAVAILGKPQLAILPHRRASPQSRRLGISPSRAFGVPQSLTPTGTLARSDVASGEQSCLTSGPMNTAAKLLFAIGLSLKLIGATSAADAGGADAPRDLNTPRTFPAIDSRADWQKRALEIRQHVQFATGLWPMPEKTPLNERTFGRIERDGYSVEKVYFETYPGFFLAGNLYRPLGKGTGPFPAILNPHGHWRNGRMADEDLGSIAARCISFARQGMIAFSYDMVGYNDTIQVDHTFASNATNLLWNISLMGLQTWNSIRALDFLESLPDVADARSGRPFLARRQKLIACTGESGGGTQTFILGAVDDRLAVQAPIVMVSHSMQGGCLCENAPGLRVDYSNMEIAAARAPRPQIIVAATGDWTKKTMEVEGPAIEKVYKLLGAEDQFEYRIFDYPHNYNKETREAVYTFFDKWVLKSERSKNESKPYIVKEGPYTKEPDADLRVFPDGRLPPSALKEPELIASLIGIYSRQLETLKPVDPKSLEAWQSRMMPAWKHALQLQHVRGGIPQKGGETVTIRRQPDDKEVTVTFRAGDSRSPRSVALLVQSSLDGDASRQTATLPESLHSKGITVVSLAAQRSASSDQFKNYFHAYNRTYAQELVADIKVAADYLRDRFPRADLVIIGSGNAALAALLAAPLANAVVADAAGVDESKDSDLLKPGVFFPGSRRIGSLQGVAALAAPNPLFVHNFSNLKSDWLPALYKKNSAHLKLQKERASDSAVAEWIGGLSRN